jgi:hypothetical protein
MPLLGENSAARESLRRKLPEAIEKTGKNESEDFCLGRAKIRLRVE